MSVGEAVRSSWDDFRVLAWQVNSLFVLYNRLDREMLHQNYVRRLRGEECKISTMNNTWTGHWARDLRCHLPELFLYSKYDMATHTT